MVDGVEKPLFWVWMKALGTFTKNNFRNLRGMSVLNDHPSTNISKVESDRKMMMPISALVEVHEEENNAIEKVLIADISRINVPKTLKNSGSMKQASINASTDAIKAIKAIKSLEGESKNLGSTKSASINAINAIKASEGVSLATNGEGKQVELSE